MRIYEELVVVKPDDTIYNEQSGVEYEEFQKYTYYSRTAERDTNVNILLPPGYSEEKEYPVLYILHGFWDNEEWMARPVVGLSTMLSNLYASKEAEEMIFGENEPYIMLISASKADGVVGSSPMDYHNYMTENNVEHLWHELSDTGHDHSSVKPHLYNFLRLIFKER